MRKINFKQPKYIFPAVIVVPLAALIYFIAQIVGGNDDSGQVATDRLNSNLPEAQIDSYGRDKLTEMNRRYDTDDDALTAIDAIGQEVEQKEKLDEDGYTESERAMIEALKRQHEEQEKMNNLQNRLNRSQNSLPDYDSDAEYQRQMAEIRRMTNQRMEEMEGPDKEELARAEAERRAREEAERKEAERPLLVVKATETDKQMFNTVSTADSPSSDSPLIKAMIDKTTKASEGTRLRFKLLDDVIVKDVKLPKGTYMYGTVSGFTDQRVKAKITNILVGSRFLKVDLSVYDNDGMEGFYVPASSFREFMKEAGSGVMDQNINISTNSSGNEISGEALALQALQNIYTAGTSAITKNIRKNKAKIKYNTIVYLINSNESR